MASNVVWILDEHKAIVWDNKETTDNQNLSQNNVLIYICIIDLERRISYFWFLC